MTLELFLCERDIIFSGVEIFQWSISKEAAYCQLGSRQITPASLFECNHIIRTDDYFNRFAESCFDFAGVVPNSPSSSRIARGSVPPYTRMPQRAIPTRLSALANTCARVATCFRNRDTSKPLTLCLHTPFAAAQTYREMLPRLFIYFFLEKRTRACACRETFALKIFEETRVDTKREKHNRAARSWRAKIRIGGAKNSKNTKIRIFKL